MALRFTPFYTVDFQTEAGSNITWVLDILRSYEENTIPSWFVDGLPPTVERMTCAADPITIEYHKDRDVYKPIQGSSASVNLVVERTNQYIALNEGSPFEFQARLQYRPSAEPAGGQRVTGITFESYDGMPPDDVAIPSGSYANVQVTPTADRDETTPIIGFASTGRNLYASTNGGLDVVFVGTIINTTGSNTNQSRIRVNADGSPTAASDRINAAVNPGAETWLADVGDTGIATSFVSAPTLAPYWCGFINSVAGDEVVGTFPFETSYKAVDGLGALESSSVPQIDPELGESNNIFDGLNQIKLIDVIFYALIQTGLDLDVYIDTKIQANSSDALISALANPYSFYTDEDKTEVSTLKEAIEGILSAFNAKITQSAGKWYIFNASTHGGTGVTESATWDTYTVNNGLYVSGGTATESLRYNITGTSGDLIPSNNDLSVNNRRPYGSVECKPVEFTPRNVADNGGFELGSTGWQANPDSRDPLEFSTTIRLEGERSIVSDRNRRTLLDGEDVWFESSEGYAVESEAEIEISIDWLGEILTTSGNRGVRNVRLAYQVFFVPNSIEETDSGFDTSEILLPFGPINLRPFFNRFDARALYWNFTDTEWKPQTNSFVPGSTTETLFREPNVTELTKELIAGTAEAGEWLNDKITIDAPREYYDPEDSAFYDIPEGKIFLRFFYPRGNRQKGSGKSQFRQHGEGSLRAYVDNIQINSNFENDIDEPVFERIQTDYTTTYTYEPKFASQSHDLIIQTLPQKEYNRTGVTEVVSLEEIGTQLKLNDFRNVFSYYEGSLINNTSTPLSNHHKVMVDFASVAYTESSSCILNGGTFNPKKNLFKVAMYVPNQIGLDQSPVNRMAVGMSDRDSDGNLMEGFYNQNIDLVSTPFLGRSRLVNYILNIDLSTIDGEGTAVVDGLTMAKPFLLIAGIPGQIVETKISLTPLSTFEGNRTMTNVSSDTASVSTEGVYSPGGTPHPFHTTWPTTSLGAAVFQEVQGNLELTLSTTIPEKTELETLYISGEIEELIVGNSFFDIGWTLDSGVTSSTLSDLGRVRGAITGNSIINAIINPPLGQTLDATTFSATTSPLPTGVTSVIFTQLGTGVFVTASVTFQPEDVAEADAAITVSGNPPTTLDLGVETSMVTLNFREDPDNNDGGVEGINFASLASNQLQVTGVAGTSSEYLVQINANDTYELNSNNFSASIPSAITNVVMSDALGGGDSVQIPLRIDFLANTAIQPPVTVDILGTSQKIGEETVSVTIRFFSSSDEVTVTEAIETYTGVPGTSVPFVNDIIPLAGLSLTGMILGVRELTDVDAATLTTSFRPGRGKIQGRINFSDNTDLVAAVDQNIDFDINTTVAVETYRYNVDQSTTFLLNASLNRTAIRQPFSNNDLNGSFDVFYQVAGVGNFAFLISDALTIDYGRGSLIGSLNNGGNGIWNFTVRYPYPTTVAEDVFDTLTISGSPTATSGLDDLVLVVLNFADSVNDGSPAVPSVTILGRPGDLVRYYSVVQPDANFRAISANITTTDGDAITTIGADITRGLTVVTPIDIRIPGSNDTVALTVDGDTIPIDITTLPYTLTINAAGDNFTIPDFVAPNAYRGVSGQVIESNVFIQADAGYNLTGVQALSAPTGVTTGVVSTQGDGITIPISVAPTSTNVSGTLAFTVVSVIEPHLLTLNLSENLPNGKLSTTSLSQRFGENDSTITFSGVTIRPLDTTNSYPNLTTFTISEDAASADNYSYSDGSVSFDLSITLPTTFVARDITQPVTILAAVAPVLNNAISGRFGTDAITLPLAGGVAKTSIISNGITSIWFDTTPIVTDEALDRTVDQNGFSIVLSAVTTDNTRVITLRSGSASTGTILDTINVNRTATVDTTINGLETFPVRITPGTGSDTTVYRYVDGTGQTRTAAAFAGDQPTVLCIAGTTQSIANASVEFVSRGGSGGADASATTGSGLTCASGETGAGDTFSEQSGDAATLDGMTYIFVAAGLTPDPVPANTIYFEYNT